MPMLMRVSEGMEISRHGCSITLSLISMSFMGCLSFTVGMDVAT